MLFVCCPLLRVDGSPARCPDTIMPSRQRYSKKSLFRGLGLRYRTLFYEKLRRAAARNPETAHAARRGGRYDVRREGCVRHIMGPLASRREAFATFGRNRPHKFWRSDFTADIYIRKISRSCFVHRPVRQVMWQEPCWTPRDGMCDVAAAERSPRCSCPADRDRREKEWNENSVWNNIIWYSLAAVPL